ncbi:MAG: cell division protein FtsZ [Ruminococcaceae bacterium]|nr:cell division protein FtsZ [Oscillospiraceae bacterium]
MLFEHDNTVSDCGVKIKIIGVGGGGGNAVNRMVAANVQGVEIYALNTDKLAFKNSEVPNKVIIGEKITRGYGAGAKPQIGARAAEESIEDIREILEGTDMVFITAGMGGGTGTGAAPIVARMAREMDILTIGIVTKPFQFEGPVRMKQAEAGIAELAQYVDSLVVIPNERLKLISSAKITLSNAFNIADDVLRRGVQSISDLINVPGFINLDFADVTSVMANAGYAHMGVGAATGKDKAELAAKEAISSPLLETSIKGAKGILISMAVSPDVGLEDVDYASALITQEASPDANIIWGVSFDENLENEMRITIIATGFEKKPEDEKRAGRTVKTNPESPFRVPKNEETPAPAESVTKIPAAKPLPPKRPPVRRPSSPETDGLDDMFAMIKGSKK